MNPRSNCADRLEFVLPDFTRLSWTDDKARGVWEPRVRRIHQAWSDIEWISVATGVRTCALIRVPPEELVTRSAECAEFGLSVLPLVIQANNKSPYGATVSNPKPGEAVALRVAVGALSDLTRFRSVWQAGNDDEMGSFLGYPACCREAFRQRWVERNSVDTTWAMAADTAHTAESDRCIDLNGLTLTNVLWRWMGVRAVPHLPCRFDCNDTILFGERLRNVGIRLGYEAEMGWVEQILSWPLEWSALHGIAEVKTPVLKVTTRTDATASKYVVRWNGSSFPREGARGLRFPYIVPERPLLTESPSFLRGLDHLIQPRPFQPDWYHCDNGFSSRHVMDAQQKPIVELARKHLTGVRGNIIDLGCGNGALLKKICDGAEGLIPFGVDMSASVLENAHKLMPEFARNFFHRDLFDPDLWPGTQRYALAILMVGRLHEVPEEKSAKLLAAISAFCERLLVYVYPGWSKEDLQSLAEGSGLHLGESSGRTAAIVEI